MMATFYFMANYLIQEAKKHTWKFLIPAGLLLSFSGALAIVGIPILILGIIDLARKLPLHRFKNFLSSTSRRIILASLIFGIPFLIVTHLLTFLGIILFIFLVGVMLFLVNLARAYGKLPKNLI